LSDAELKSIISSILNRCTSI